MSYHHLYKRIRSELGHPAVEDTRMVVRYHFAQSMFGEAAVLFGINGLTVVIELGRPLVGAVLLVAGLVLSVSGLMAAFALERERKPSRLVSSLQLLAIAAVSGELGFIGGHLFSVSIARWMFWVAFLAALVIVFVTRRFYYRHRMR